MELCWATKQSGHFCLASTGVCDRADLLEEKVYFVTLMTNGYHFVKHCTYRHKRLGECNNHGQMFWYEFMPVEREIALKKTSSIVSVIFLCFFQCISPFMVYKGSKINVFPWDLGIR